MERKFNWRKNKHIKILRDLHYFFSSNFSLIVTFLHFFSWTPLHPHYLSDAFEWMAPLAEESKKLS